MASVGPLFLLMIFLISTVTISTSARPKQKTEVSPKAPSKTKERFKDGGKLILENINEIREVVVPFLGLLEDLPYVGPIVSSILTGVSVIDQTVNDKSILKDIQEEFKNLDSKLEQYNMEQKWNSWASGAYHKPELKIKVAWSEYKMLVGALALAKDEAEKERHRKEFMKAYSKYKSATSTLRELLKPEGTTLISKLGDQLAEHVQCHEKDLREYTVFFQTLLVKGYLMNDLYYRMKNIQSQARVDEEVDISYDVASAMFHIHEECIKNSMNYVVKDVRNFIDKTKTRDDLANKVWSFLNEAYDRYDWMVVAFITKKSSYKLIKTLNKHVLSGFTEVSKEDITVAVARQVKGKTTRAEGVMKAIKECIDKLILCYKVAEKLSKCDKKVSGIPLNQAYTAVHAYTRNAHESHGAKEVEKEEEEDVTAAPSAPTPYIYRGECKKSPGVKGGKFVVLIKSDEEMMETDPCKTLDCGGESRGKCVRMNDIFLALCDCKPPYYGKNCENSKEDYKKTLEEEIKKHENDYKGNNQGVPAGNNNQGVRVVDSRRRTQRRD